MKDDVMGHRVGLGLGLADDVCELVMLSLACCFNGSSARRWSWCSGETLPGGLAPCDGESLRGVSPSHVAGPGARFLFRIIPSYTKRSARAGNAVDVGTGGRLRPAVRPGRSLRVLRSWKLRSSAAGRRSGHLHKTGTEPGHIAGTNGNAIRGVHCRPQALSVFRSCAVVELLSTLCACRLLSRARVEWCCSGLPPPGSKRSVAGHILLCQILPSTAPYP